MIKTKYYSIMTDLSKQGKRAVGSHSLLNALKNE